MLHKLDFVVAILVLSPPLHCLKCYTNFCLDGSEYCEQRCSRNESACVSSYHVNPRGSTVDLLFFQCSHAKTDACNNPVCDPAAHDSGIHSCCCNTDLCNSIPTTEFTSPPLLPTPEGTVPPLNENQLVCEVYNCSRNSECFYGYETCRNTPLIQASDTTYQFCFTSLSFESDPDEYILWEKGCGTTTDVTEVRSCQDSCHIDTSSTTPQTSCCCTEQLCNSEASTTYSDVSRLSFINDPCADTGIACSHSCIVVSGTPRCLCPAGFALDSSNQMCVDINECLEPNHCEVCINHKGSFECACSDDRLLQDDGYTCEDPTGLLCTLYSSNCNGSICQPSTHHCDKEYSSDVVSICLSTYYLISGGTFELRLAACFADQATATNCASGDKCVLKVHPSQTTVYTCCCNTNFCNSHINVVFPNVTNDSTATDRMIVSTGTNLYTDDVSTDPTTGTPGSGSSLSTSLKVFIAVVVISLFIVACPIVVVLWCLYSRRNKTFHTDTAADLPIMLDNSNGDKPELKELIGHGQFASVWRAKYQDSEVAVKAFLGKDYESYKTELDMYMTPLTSRNILRFISYYDCFNQTYHLVFEFHPRGSLYNLLKHNTIELKDFCELAESVAAGLAYLHQETMSHPPKPAIAHRDLKSKNVLVKNDGQCCISDFGLAVKFQSGTEHMQISHGQVGTSRYMAPEVLEGAINFGRDPYLRIDDYALGLIIWEIASRTIIPNATAKEYKAPFEEETPPNPTIEEMRAVVVTRQQRPAMPSGFQNNAVFDPITDTISEAWDADAESRLSAQCVYERIRSFRIEHFGTGSQISKDSGFHHEQDTLQSTPPPPATPSFSSIASDQKPLASTSYELHTASVENPKSHNFFSKMQYNYNTTHSTETTV